MIAECLPTNEDDLQKGVKQIRKIWKKEISRILTEDPSKAHLIPLGVSVTLSLRNILNIYKTLLANNGR